MGSNSSHTKLSRAVLLALAINISLALSYIGLWIIAARDDLLWRADFSAFYTGGAIVRDGLGSQLYDLDLQTQYQQTLLGGRSFSQDVLPFNTPPYLALLIAPLALLSLSQAFWLWALIQLIVLFSLILMLISLTSHWQFHERLLLILITLALPGMLRNFLLGALSLWMLLCLLGWYAALKRSSDHLAGIWILFGSIKPQIMVSPVMVSLAGRRWKTIEVIIIGGILVFLTSSLVLGLRVWPDFLERLIASGSYFDEYGINPAAMYNLKGMLTIWLRSAWAKQINLVSLLAFIFSLILTIWLWRGKWEVQSPVFTIRMSFTLFLGIFFSLHVNLQDGLLLVAPALLFYEYLRQRDLPRKLFAILAISCPTLFLLDEFFLSKWLPIRLAVVVMIIMLIWSGIYLRTEDRQIVPERNSAENINE